MRYELALYRPNCEPNMTIWRWLVLHFCVRPLNGALLLQAIMYIRTHPILFYATPCVATVHGRPGIDQRNAGRKLAPRWHQWRNSAK